MQDPSYVCVGKILGPQGLQGAMRLRSYTQSPDALMRYSPLYAGEGGTPLSVTSLKPGPRNELIAICSGIKDRTAAEALKGADLVVPRTALPSLEEEEYYHADLIGLSVRLGHSQEDYGVITGVYNLGAGDLLALSVPDYGAVYIPFRKSTVTEVHCKAGYVVVDPAAIEDALAEPAQGEQNVEA